MSSSVLNLNVGILGHVDSGKTSLAKALSTTASTASFDKNPESQVRGITIDLGFSSLLLDMPQHLKNLCSEEKLQLTLVDCPGHASLIRTIIGVDVTKGMQTQTAECLVIGEVTCQKMIVVLNKTDLLPEGKRTALIDKMTKRMKLTLANSVFKDAPVVSVAANPGGSEGVQSSLPVGLQDLTETLQKFAFVPERHILSPFLFAVDHCFGVRGQGTVMTGTVLQGAVNVNDTVEIPSVHVTKKVKSLQMFRRPVERAVQGDRIGICISQFDPNQLERGIVCMPGYVPAISSAIISVQKIKYFKGSLSTKAKFHISIGHETVMAKLSFFSLLQDSRNTANDNSFDFDKEYKFQEELLFDSQKDDTSITAKEMPVKQFALLEFEKPVLAFPNCLIIGSKLDTDIHTNTCRLAFWGHLLEGIEDKSYSSTVLPRLKIYKEKCKSGIIDRASNQYEVIGKNMFKKETNIQLFVGLQVELSTGETGIIESSFGQSGKVKIRIPDGLNESTYELLSGMTKRKGKQTQPQNTSPDPEPIKIALHFKRYIYDPKKKMVQS
ncbi:selenocysteine-specific elongation factor isoform X2 [Cryptotermes secundus]|uniref:selenocysteine-specific elongation factor isoform X2 n=1 Tax=Cryptotermes secundus TaxID=105785 RepID=UPI001454E097|nr:selenocysteine-specific elongation factor isoform X2 [Cryptotermes secundus]